MQKKTKTYLLLALVLGIWGTVAYKIISGINPDMPATAPTTFQVEFKPKDPVTVETFTINSVERDPFLGNLRGKVTPQQHTNTTNSKRNKHKEILAWPKIVYNGLLQKNKKAPIYIITIGQDQYLVKEGQTVDDVKLQKADNTSITVRFKGEQKVISKT